MAIHYLYVDGAWHTPDDLDPNLTQCGMLVPYHTDWQEATPAELHCPAPEPVEEPVKPKGKKKG